MPKAAPNRSRMVYALTAIVLSLSSCASPRDGLTRVYAGLADLGNSIARLGAPADPPLPHGLVQVDAGGSYVYLLPARDGFIAVDSGFQADARAVRAALDGRPLYAVLLTHGHIDHTEGAAALNAPTWLGAADHAVLRDERHLRCFLSHGAQHLIGSSPPPADLRRAQGGTVVRVGETEVRAVATPGHTPGSLTWVWRDLAFTGDAIVNPTGRGLLPSLGTTESPRDAWRGLRVLAREAPEVRVIYDAHYGPTTDAPRALREALEHHFH